MKKRVAIQGVRGSNHYSVARDYFGDEAEIHEFLSFDGLVECLTLGNCDYGIMALENTIAGSIIPNYALIDYNGLKICGEYYLNIHHHLMAMPGQQIEDIQEVCSHPMALLQCKEFFKGHRHIKLVEDVDTAEVAQRIAKNELKGVAAIAPKKAADLFDLEVLEDDIQTIRNNATRFVIVQKPVTEVTRSHRVANDSLDIEDTGSAQNQINKASLKFELEHKRGSLAALLNVMSDCKLNLTKIQSLPKIETPWKYAFFVDVTFDTYEDYAKAKAVIEIMAEEFTILGEYKNGRS
ncbi:prephenate dehydratase [Pseudotenacibaculum haliotis]|uniref:prephenate dehydratase n=1 Tax=Pseudotenacibaculum haliotis TaxID=1862138 RepID=A0ABW5LV86_9FLAO